MIVIVDYEAGNLKNVYNALRFIGENPVVTSDPRELERAEKIILPGVGAFGFAHKSLEKRGLLKVLLEKLDKGTPFLGICLGFQLLFEFSEEGNVDGFGLFPGRVKRFSQQVVVPHIGWNQIRIVKENPLLKGIADGSYFYFVHSYYVAPADAGIVSTLTDYDGEFCSMIWSDNIFATQFHPEKSQKKGLHIFKNFVNL